MFFNIQKDRHFAKIKTIYGTFLYSQLRTLCVLRFHMILEIGGGLETFLNAEQIIHFSLLFYIKKTMHFELCFCIQKA